MSIDFVRFKATDDVELQGWLSKRDDDTAVIHVHGMGGNGYENYFLDNLSELYAKLGISLFTFDNRGRGTVSDFRKNDDWKHAGSCFEIFEESVHDIDGAMSYLKSIGFTRFILQGHSLGGSKIVNYLIERNPHDIEKVILLAPTDMVAWAGADPEHENNLTKAKQLLSQGKDEELVGAQCWPPDKTPLSAQAYLSKSNAGAPVDIYGVREDGSTLIGKVSQPMLIAYSTSDIGITRPFGSMGVYKERLNKIKNPNTQLQTIDGSSHAFSGFEAELVDVIERFVQK